MLFRSIIGKKIAEQFFYKTNAIGQFVRIDNVPFQVVGVLQGEGRMFDGGDLGEMVLIPITTARATLIRSPFPRNVHYVVVQGKNDPRVPYTEAEQIVAQLKKQGTPVWFLMALDEGHGFAKKANADFLFYAQIMFLRETLLK